MDYTSVNQVQIAYKMLGTDKVSFVGYPLDMSICSIASNGCFGISAASANQKAIWEFIRQFYLERKTTALSTNVDALEERLENATDLETDMQGTILIGQGKDTYEVKIGSPTQNDRIILTKLIRSFDRMHRYDATVMEQIITLATPYWDDTQDIDSTVQKIDDYLQEYFSNI